MILKYPKCTKEILRNKSKMNILRLLYFHDYDIFTSSISERKIKDILGLDCINKYLMKLTKQRLIITYLKKGYPNMYSINLTTKTFEFFKRLFAEEKMINYEKWTKIVNKNREIK